MDKRLACFLIALAASLWGVIGIFVTNLSELGFTSIQIVAVRTLTATLFLIGYTLYKNRNLLKIKVRDSKYFIGTGIISIVFFNWSMFRAIEETSISIAAILLYTAPIFVTIFARILFKEKFTKRKLAALLTTFIGCAFVVGMLPNSNLSISFYGLILGLGSGLFYALYSIFGKFALKKYDSLTVTVYTFLFAAIAVTPFSGIGSVLSLFSQLEVWINIVGLGFLSTMVAFILYTKGLTKVESSQASIIATIEPVVAFLTSFLVFNERLTLWQYMGIIMVIAAIMIVQEPKTMKASTVPKGSSMSEKA